MEMNTAMRFVMVRASAEAAAAKNNAVGVEHVFCGLMKLSEMDVDQFAPTSKHKGTIQQDIERVEDELDDHGIDSAKARSAMRKMLAVDPPADDAEKDLTRVFQDAEKRLEGTYEEKLTATAVIQTILETPNAMIKAACGSMKKPTQKEPPAPEPEKEISPEEGKAFLPKLTESIRSMRYTLLEKVMGQDHVVHALAEGIFSAEVLAAADEKRKRPKAIFVFAGPPGVGKTFLAEQAAEALGMPFKRFDMSGYSDHQQHVNLIGYAPSYKDAKPGVLTGFVKENPSCILLFDEIEKAHINTIHLFLQILDAGRLHDDFLDEDVFFKDTLIIFTTNAGRQLYEGDAKMSAAGLPRKTILGALETDTHPQTGKPFFPAAICSRIATGWPLMFNHLQAHNLEDISAGEFKRFCGLFEKQYGIEVTADKLLSTTLLFAEGGQADARTLRAQTELFFKNEIFKLCRLWGDSFESVLQTMQSIHFSVESDNLPGDISPLFSNPEKPKLLLFAEESVAKKCTRILDNDHNYATLSASEMAALINEHGGRLRTYDVYATQDPEEAYALAGKHDFSMVLLDLAPEGDSGIDPEATATSLDEPSPVSGTIYDFEYIPIAAASLSRGRVFFKNLRERLPELPVYLLETEKFSIDEELLTAFVRAGARGKLALPANESSVFEDEVAAICQQLYLQQAAAMLAAQRKILYFETAPKLSADKTEATIRIRDLTLKRALSAEDSSDVLDDVEKPNVSFDQVIGAGDAKQELKFFIDYLKSPKKFAAQNLKPPKGVLLHGPPGTGKTLLARAMAGESDVAFIPATASSFVTKYQGSGPEAVRGLFKRARKYAPAIIFIDEIDAIGRARGGPGSSHGEEMALNALLTEMDGFTVDPKRPVFVLAATNFGVEEGESRMGTIDAALARRFDRKILVDLPNKQDRKQFLEMMLGKHQNHKVTRKMIERLAGRSTGMSLANLTSVIELASRTAVRKGAVLGDEILEESFEITKHGEKKEWGHEYLERVARHEAGHAFMCYLAGATPSYLTIVARGGHGGYMEHADDEGSPLKTKEELLGRIRTSLGGRAAELVYYGEKDGVSSGASGDLQSATRVARAMICSYGMDSAVGLASMDQKEAATGPMAAKITERVNEILAAELKSTVAQIEKARDKMDKLVTQLLEKNKLTKVQIEKALK